MFDLYIHNKNPRWKKALGISDDPVRWLYITSIKPSYFERPRQTRKAVLCVHLLTPVAYVFVSITIIKTFISSQNVQLRSSFVFLCTFWTLFCFSHTYVGVFKHPGKSEFCSLLDNWKYFYMQLPISSLELEILGKLRSTNFSWFSLII